MVHGKKDVSVPQLKSTLFHIDHLRAVGSLCNNVNYEGRAGLPLSLQEIPRGKKRRGSYVYFRCQDFHFCIVFANGREKMSSSSFLLKNLVLLYISTRICVNS